MVSGPSDSRTDPIYELGFAFRTLGEEQVIADLLFLFYSDDALQPAGRQLQLRQQSFAHVTGQMS